MVESSPINGVCTSLSCEQDALLSAVEHIAAGKPVVEAFVSRLWQEDDPAQAMDKFAGRLEKLRTAIQQIEPTALVNELYALRTAGCPSRHLPEGEMAALPVPAELLDNFLRCYLEYYRRGQSNAVLVPLVIAAAELRNYLHPAAASLGQEHRREWTPQATRGRSGVRPAPGNWNAGSGNPAMHDRRPAAEALPPAEKGRPWLTCPCCGGDDVRRARSSALERVIGGALPLVRVEAFRCRKCLSRFRRFSLRGVLLAGGRNGSPGTV